MARGFRDFLLRGNVVDLAVAVVIGAAFGAVVAAFATDFIGGIIGAIGGTPNFGDAGPTVNGSKIVYGSTITALVNFLIVAAAIYFVVVMPMNALASRRADAADADTPAPSDEARLLTEIRDLLAEGRRP
jgi:large conductance mechanosensitive channel